MGTGEREIQKKDRVGREREREACDPEEGPHWTRLAPDLQLPASRTGRNKRLLSEAPQPVVLCVGGQMH